MVHLIGWMWSAELALGRQLATKLGCGFITLDDAIADRAGMATSQLLAEQGGCLLRALEGEMLHQLCFDGVAKVLATGDDALLRAPNRQRLADSGLVVWLDAGNQSPQHNHLYGQMAGLHLDANQLSHDELVAAICCHICLNPIFCK